MIQLTKHHCCVYSLCGPRSKIHTSTPTHTMCVVGVKVCILDLGSHSIYVYTAEEDGTHVFTVCTRGGAFHSPWATSKVANSLLTHLPGLLASAGSPQLGGEGHSSGWLAVVALMSASSGGFLVCGCACMRMCMCICAPYESSGVLWLCTVHTSLKSWDEEPVLPTIPGVTSTPTYLHVMLWSVHTLCI